MADDGSGVLVRRATMRGVAERAGVAKSLVSLAFSSPESVSPQRLGRILRSAGPCWRDLTGCRRVVEGRLAHLGNVSGWTSQLAARGLRFCRASLG